MINKQIIFYKFVVTKFIDIMRRIILMFATAFCIGCTTNQDSSEITTINIEPVITDTTQIPASKLGRTIRYVALETGDSTTFVSRSPLVRQWRDKIIVSSDKNTIKVFDAKTGKYLNSIGEISRGPRGNANLEVFYVHPENGNVYLDLMRRNREKQIWDINGNLLRTVKFPEISRSNWISILMPQVIDNQGRFIVPIPVSNGFADCYSLALFNEGDTIATRIVEKRDSVNFKMTDIESITIFAVGSSVFGSMSLYGMMNLKTKDMNLLEGGNEQTLWKYKDIIYFKQPYQDTVYQLIDTVIKPVIHFNMGQYAYKDKERFKKDQDLHRFKSVTHVYENDNVMLLEWSMGANIGVYNKADQTLIAGRYQDGIQDDINNFLPLTIHTMNDDGGFLAIIDPIRVVDWNEANPDKTSPLPNIKEDANIVIAIIE